MGLKKFVNDWPNLVFVLVPFLFFTLLLFRIVETHFYFQVWYDPVYAYLMNGLTFSLGSNDIGHTDHPGTPLQIFIAIFISILGWIRGSNDLATDVLTHPESYLRIITIALIVINCFMLWILGFFAYKKLRNRNMAVVLQLIPLFTFQLFNFLPVVACESVIILLSIAIASFIILYDNREEGGLKLVVIIALFSALSVATKISTLSILIVPFFFFEKKKTKVIFVILSLAFIILFISPVIAKLENFTGFLGKIATHTGKYGSGDAKLFDSVIFFQSIKQMIMKEFAFTMHLLLLPVGWIVIRKRNITGSLKRLYVGITIATLIQVVLVGRHYSFHYLMPVFALFMPLHGYFWIQLFREKINTVTNWKVSLFLIILVIVVFGRLIVRNKFEKEITNPVEKTSQAIKSEWKGKYIILSDYNNGCAFIDPALRFGLAYSGGTMKKIFAPILASVYPGNYIWNSRDGFFNFTTSFIASDIFSINPQIYIYANAGKCEVSMVKISDMINQNGLSEFVKLKKVNQNEKSGEVIALAITDKDAIMKFNKPELVIETSMEELTASGDQFKSNDEEYSFKGVNFQSRQFARTGNSSLLLTPSNQFGLNITIPVSIGKRFKLEFWQRSTDQNQALVVASAAQSELFYKTSGQVENKKGEWTRSELNFVLPDNFTEAAIQFYLYNPASDSVWMDDFRLMVFK